jgi:hypothetical protein
MLFTESIICHVRKFHNLLQLRQLLSRKLEKKVEIYQVDDETEYLVNSTCLQSKRHCESNFL